MYNVDFKSDQLRRVPIACSDLYGDLVGHHKLGGGFCVFARQAFQVYLHTPIAYGKTPTKKPYDCIDYGHSAFAGCVYLEVGSWLR